MGRNWEEGELFVWGDDGLVPADSQEKAVRSAAEPARALPLETPPVRRSEEPAVRRVGRSSGLGEIVTGVDEASGIVRTAPKVLPRRQRSTYESDDDFCNDPEELESRQAQKKAARPKKERPSLFVRAIGSLARREYSRRDLEAKLRRSLSEDEDPDEVGRVLDRLEGAGYLSDARFAESRARSRSRVMGDARIRRSRASAAWRASMSMLRWTRSRSPRRSGPTGCGQGALESCLRTGRSATGRSAS
ncbi:MAG: regulatory protein RecX [Sutterella wadsworthensis]